MKLWYSFAWLLEKPMNSGRHTSQYIPFHDRFGCFAFKMKPLLLNRPQKENRLLHDAILIEKQTTVAYVSYSEKANRIISNRSSLSINVRGFRNFYKGCWVLNSTFQIILPQIMFRNSDDNGNHVFVFKSGNESQSGSVNCCNRQISWKFKTLVKRSEKKSAAKGRYDYKLH